MLDLTQARLPFPDLSASKGCWRVASMENEPPQMEDKKSPTTAGLSPGRGLVNFTDCHGAVTGACRKLLGKDQSQTPKVSSCAQDSAKGALNLQVCPAYCKLMCECITVLRDGILRMATSLLQEPFQLTHQTETLERTG